MIVIQMAMRAEAAPVIERLGLEAAGAWPGMHFEAHEGRVEGEPVALAVAGEDPRHKVDAIGTQPSTLLAHLAIERWSPRLVVSAGTAGGFGAHGAEIGDVYLSERTVVFHDRRIDLPGFHDYGIGSYPCMDATPLAQALGMKLGVVSTGNSLDLPEADLDVMRRTGARVKEMEAAAIAWVCELHDVEFLAVKSITDLLDGEHPTGEAFLANLRLASGRLAEAIQALMPRLSSHAARR